ncbi:hypothetical protein ACIP98_14230 [Streptomyces sp. NPDC088354]|uniref:hypothetical protein n=1 Tax=unclassified Streptomyces TaxID=2593676 RepID=UPI0029AB44F8|nr:hypothetical protein [Streptomyces sp. MI02-7b]MDX3070988.1 hypothetical protein [Streptomyces sp. MI02-7b]
MREDCALSVEEVRALNGIEGLLRRDRALARRLRTMRPYSLRRDAAARFARWPRALLVSFLGGCSLALLLAAAMTKDGPLLWAFAVAWGATLLSAAWPATAWWRRWARPRASRQPYGMRGGIRRA